MAHPIGRADVSRLCFLALRFACLLLITVCLWSFAAAASSEAAGALAGLPTGEETATGASSDS
jgi:hypothetical protein